MNLTREEQKSVLRMVMESHQGVTLNEAKSNIDIREEMKLNLEFYNALKEDGQEKLDEIGGAISDLLGILGNIKDFMTASDELSGKGKIAKIAQRIASWLQSKIGGFVDKYIPQKVQDAAAKVKGWISWLANFISKTLSYEGLAKVFAMIRYKTLKPKDEQKQCMIPVAKEIFRWIVITLVVAFIIKMIMILGPVLFATAKATAAATSASTATVQTAGFSLKNLAALGAALAPLKMFLIKLGFKGAAGKIFGAYSASEKHKKQDKLKQDLEAYKAELQGNIFQKIGGLWNYCPLPEKK